MPVRSTVLSTLAILLVGCLSSAGGATIAVPNHARASQNAIAFFGEGPRSLDSQEGLPLIIPASEHVTPDAPIKPRAHRAPICAGSGSHRAPPAKLACCYMGQTTVRDLVHARSDGYARCYDAALARDSTIRGRFSARFTVDADGVIRKACEERDEERTDDIDDPELARCLVGELTKVQLPALGSDCPTMHIVYPMVFRPSE